MKSTWEVILILLVTVLLAAPNAESARKAVQPGPGAPGEWRLIG
jgi:hypothetical protein